jgi:hypothetical protein
MKFMMIVKGDEQSEAGEMPHEGIVKAMLNYNQELVNAGALLAAEGLQPTARGARVKFSHGKPTVTDGPFGEAKEVIAGYWLIQAESKAEAIQWALRCPGAPLEIRQLFELADFPVSENESGWREAEEEARARLESQPPVQPGLKQFIIFRMADRDTEAGLMPSEPLLEAMGKYNDEMMRAGIMLGGEGLQPGAKGARIDVVKGKRTVIDGPFTEAKELVAGFTLIQVRSKAEAIDWVKRWPALDAGGEAELEVREVFAATDFGAELTPELRDVHEHQRTQIAGKH